MSYKWPSFSDRCSMSSSFVKANTERMRCEQKKKMQEIATNYMDRLEKGSTKVTRDVQRVRKDSVR